MNIFVLDENPKQAAIWHNDRHTVKMILESAQLLCITHVQTQSKYIPAYKGNGFRNHPCAVWVRESVENYDWLCKLGLALCDEYTYRYEKIHSTQSVLIDLQNNVPNLPMIKMTPFALAMPDNCKIPNDPIQSYRKYYINEKRHLAKWTKRNKPYWYI